MTVDGAPAENPAAFAALFDDLPPAQAVLDAPPVEIRIGGLPEAWVDRVRAIEYFPAEEVLRRDHQWVKVSPEVAAVIEGDEIAPVAAPVADAPARPSALWLAPLGLLAAAVASVWLVRRGRGREREGLVGG